MAITIGTKIPEIISASRWIGALEPCASWTIRMIWASAVSLPTFIARNWNEPVLLIVAPMTSLPTFFSTGMDSPVIMDSSTDDVPFTITPSTAIFSPGRTTTISPTSTCSIGRSISLPLRTTLAVFACKPINFLIASDVRPLARASKTLPTRMSVIIIAVVSK